MPEQSIESFEPRTLFEVIAETLEKEANVEAIFGEPMELDTHRIVPVAQITMTLRGWGGKGGRGSGNARRGDDEDGETEVGMGVGGLGDVSLQVTPLGFLREVEQSIEYQPIDHEPNSFLGRVEHLIRNTIRRDEPRVE